MHEGPTAADRDRWWRRTVADRAGLVPLSVTGRAGDDDAARGRLGRLTGQIGVRAGLGDEGNGSTAA